MESTVVAQKSAIRIALVCQSNVNRSMEAHDILNRNGYKCSSFGVGSKVRLPGEVKDDPNEYEFDHVTYDFIYEDLRRKNAQRYTKNGMLNMIDRDRKVKRGPARWQNEFSTKFDVVIAFEKRVFDIIVADVTKRHSERMEPVHIVNLDTTDSHMAAKGGATNCLALVERLYDTSDWENDLTTILDELEAEWLKPVLHTVLFY